MKNLNRIVLGLAVLLAVSCGKKSKNEDPEPESQMQNQVAKTCQLLSGGNPFTTYTYNTAGKVIRTSYRLPSTISTTDFEDELLYNAAGNISEIRTFHGNRVLQRYKVYTYNVHNLPDT